ncbi:MAG: TIGR04086 family membrane protein [Lachnospiraceae bacterium]|nr:TIGR04086 family membrane protein [Lachnospiraceae bacterium]MBQ9233949.1 TIGR04086 family membrane protein [Lachnospiraceae bacterium]
MTAAGRLINVLRALIIAYLVTGVLLLGIAFFMYKLGLDESKVNVAITLTYIISSAIGGIVIGKRMKEKKYIWGLLLGALYVGIILIASLLISHGDNVIAAKGLSTIILCLCGGTLGGMIS